METYSFLREFADSWFLIAMFVFFIGAAIRAFLPSRRAINAEAAGIPLRDDLAGCGQGCAGCACGIRFKEADHG